MYAFSDGSSLATETVDSGYQVGWSGSIALDLSDVPHVSYMDYFNKDLKYASWNGSSWSVETVDAAGNVGSFSSLALDSSGRPHIAYLDSTNSSMKYAWWDGGTWNTEVVDSTWDANLNASLALDFNDNPHISYRAPSGVKYARWNGTSWEIQTLAYPLRGSRTSLAFDSNWDVHVAYEYISYDYTSAELHHVVLDGPDPAVPEPSTLVIWSLLALCGIVWRRRRKA